MKKLNCSLAMRVTALSLPVMLMLFATHASAQTYPNKPIHLVLGFAPGGAADYVSRVISEPLARALGQPVVVDNKAGAGSTIAADFVAKSARDGYTILIASPSAISVNPALNPKLNYKPSDLAPVTKVSASPQVVAVNPGTGITSIAGLIAAAKKDPGKLNYATSGNGSAPHMATIQFNRLTGTQMVHVPYKSGGLAVQSVIAGDTQVTFATPPSVLPMVKAGRLRAIAVTSRARSPLVPDLPGMEESGVPDYDMSLWYGFFVPTGTPPGIIKKIFDATITALRDPAVKEAFAREGTETAASRSPEEFAAFLAEDSKLMVRLVKESGAKID
ncbi:MAG: tripartite tricarboxylate transporter substrate binding protein [Betaproteobacteria bacterium]